MISDPTCDEVRLALAVYVLGAIEPADRAVVGAHLAGCHQCRQELAGLARVTGLLHRISPQEAAELAADDDSSERATDPGLPALLGRAARARRHRLRVSAAIAVAACLIAGAGAVASWQAGLATARLSRPPVTGAPQPMRTAGAVNPVTHASAIIRYAATPWGLRLQVRVSGVPAGTTCQIKVVNSAGRPMTVGGWTIAGDRATSYPASSSVPLSALRGFVITAGSRVLVTIPIRPGSGRAARPAGSPSERSGRKLRDHRYAQLG